MENNVMEQLAEKLLAAVPGLEITRDKEGNFSEVYFADQVKFFVDPKYGFGYLFGSGQIRSKWSDLKLEDCFFVNLPDGTVDFHRFVKFDPRNQEGPIPPETAYDECCNGWHEEDMNSEVPEMLKRFLEGINEQQNLAKPSLDAKISGADARRTEPATDGKEQTQVR